jgi:hypothetical protein
MVRSSQAPLQTAAIFATALALRLAVVGAVARTHSADWFFGQATELARLADSLHSGHGLSSPFGGSTGPSAFLAPGYPAIVAGIFAIFHPYSEASAIALMVLQALFGAATVVALRHLTRRAFGVTAANVAGWVWAVSPPLLWLPTLFWETSLSILFATAIFATALYCAGHPTKATWALGGVLAAAALAVNPALLPIVACAYGWAIYRAGLRSLAAPAVGLALLILLSSPWVLRNFKALHAFIPMRSNLGYELWQGNREDSDGFFVPELHMNVNRQEFARYASLGEVGYMHEKLALAKAAIGADLPRFARLTMQRAFYFWTGIVRHSSVLIVAYIVLTSIGGLGGIWMLWSRDRGLAWLFLLPLVFFPLPYYITHPDFRFRLVIDPILVALSAYAVTSRETQTK